MRGCVREGRDSGEITQPRERLERVEERERESFRMDGRFGRRRGRSGNVEVQKMIWKGEEERECVRGCSEREDEIAREIGSEKMNAGGS